MAFLKVAGLSLLALFPAGSVVRYSLIDPKPSIRRGNLYTATSGACFAVVFVLLSRYFIPDLIRPVLQKAGLAGAPAAPLTIP